MTWPVSSQEARELREAEAAAQAEADAAPRHGRDCADGWLGEDDQGRPRPCLACRPHLDPNRDRP